MKKLLLFFLVLLSQACSSGTDWVQEEKFFELATKAVLEEYPDLTDVEAKEKLSYTMIHCQREEPCTALFFFQPDGLAEMVQVSVSDDGRYAVGDQNQGGAIYYDPST